MPVTEENNFKELLDNSKPIISLKKGNIITGTVISTSNNMILVDLNGQFTGIIKGKDLNSSIQDVSEIKAGDLIDAIILGDDIESGLTILSLKKASQIKLIERLHSNFDTKEVITVVPNEANKGGLLIDLDGIKGFIPVSQLTPINYPRVEGAEASKILEHLQKLVGKPFKVRVINVDQDGKKIIFSEKAAIENQRTAALDKLKIGDKVEGVVSGILTYGLFITFNGLEGLVHVSEIDWGHVSNPSKFAKIGDKVFVQVIGIEIDKISLSIKRLKPNPWEELSKKFKLNDIIEAPVIKISKFGIFLSLNEGVNGLIHLSEISNAMVKNVEDFAKIGDVIKAKIIAFDTKEKRIGLSIKALENPIKAEPTAKITKNKKSAEIKENNILDIKEEEYKKDLKEPKKKKIEENQEPKKTETKEEKPKTKITKKSEEKPVKKSVTKKTK